MFDVIALGEVLIDFATVSCDQNGYPTMKANAGGAPSNFLAALNKFGKKTALISKVGQDTFGELLVNTLKKAGIETSGVIMDEKFFTTLAFVTFDEKGDRSFAFSRKPGADTQLSYEEVDLKLVDNSKILHFGTLSLTHEPMITTTKKLVAYAKEQNNLISFDPNLRVPLWDDLEKAKAAMLWGLEQADFVKISDEEVEFLFNMSLEEVAEMILEKFHVKLLLLTKGADGALIMTKTAKSQAKCPKVSPIDTTGAGDICGGSAMSAFLDLGKDFGALTKEDLGKIAKFACISASLSTEKQGGIPSVPELEEISKFIH